MTAQCFTLEHDSDVTDDELQQEKLASKFGISY